MPTPPTAEPSQNLIAQRLVYAMSLLSPTRRALLPTINEHVQRLIPGAPHLTEMMLSRIAHGKRHVKDYELIAITRALDIDIDWLIGEGPVDALISRHTTR